MTMLGKWKLRLGKDDKGLWKDILCSKYESWSTLDVGKDSNHESWWWRYIRRICGDEQRDNWFTRNIRWSVGEGKKIKF